MKIEIDSIWLPEITLKVIRDELESFNEEQNLDEVREVIKELDHYLLHKLKLRKMV